MVRRVRLAVLAIVLGLGVWSAAIEPGLLRVRQIEVASPHWPAERKPLRVVVLADLHVDALHVGLDRLDDIVRRANAQTPDLILLPGDFVGSFHVGGSPPEMAALSRGLAQLTAPLGVVAVLGNHDNAYNAAAVRRALESAGITVLENASARVDTPQGPLWIAGIADDTTSRPDVARAFKDVPKDVPVIAMAHDPATFPEVPVRAILTVAGHTHGGQINLPFIGPVFNLSRAPLRHSYGLIREDGKWLYVSGGIGTSVLPVRFNRPPEFAVITTRRAAASRDR